MSDQPPRAHDASRPRPLLREEDADIPEEVLRKHRPRPPHPRITAWCAGVHQERVVRRQGPRAPRSSDWRILATRTRWPPDLSFSSPSTTTPRGTRAARPTAGDLLFNFCDSHTRDALMEQATQGDWISLEQHHRRRELGPVGGPASSLPLTGIPFLGHAVFLVRPSPRPLLQSRRSLSVRQGP